MNRTCRFCRIALQSIALTCLLAFTAEAQFPADSLSGWTNQLSVKNLSGNDRLESLINQAQAASALQRQSITRSLLAADTSNPYLLIRLKLWLAVEAAKNAYPEHTDSVQLYCTQALKKAYETGDNGMIALASWRFGQLMHTYNRRELAVMYSLNAAEISEKNGLPFEGIRYWTLGEVLYSIREYDKTIFYCRQASQKMRQDHLLVSCLNTIALAYQKLGNYDSAIVFYDSARFFLKNFGNNQSAKDEWEAIISANKGQIYFAQGNYARALPLFENHYRESKNKGINYDAANSLQWMAKTSLVLGRSAIALQQIREAWQLLDKKIYRNYALSLYATAADVFRASGINDSAFYFNRKYLALHDSIEAEIVNSRLEISRIRLENEKYYYDIQRVEQQKREETSRRDIIIVAILLLAVLALLYTNSQRQKMEYQKQIVAEKNRHAEMEIAAAREQLQAFTSSLIEKSLLVDQLQAQLEQNNSEHFREEAMLQLLQSRIITEDEWTTFKRLFEKLHPGFFDRLKEKCTGVTLAEQRIAAILRLKLTPREIAAMLGISVESAQKSRLRLKQRLNLASDQKVEDFVAGL